MPPINVQDWLTKKTPKQSWNCVNSYLINHADTKHRRKLNANEHSMYVHMYITVKKDFGKYIHSMFKYLCKYAYCISIKVGGFFVSSGYSGRLPQFNDMHPG